jgi:hypothetical protein
MSYPLSPIGMPHHLTIRYLVFRIKALTSRQNNPPLQLLLTAMAMVVLSYSLGIKTLIG